jgi:hypothetical protein
LHSLCQHVVDRDAPLRIEDARTEAGYTGLAERGLI